MRTLLTRGASFGHSTWSLLVRLLRTNNALNVKIIKTVNSFIRYNSTFCQYSLLISVSTNKYLSIFILVDFQVKLQQRCKPTCVDLLKARFSCHFLLHWLQWEIFFSKLQYKLKEGLVQILSYFGNPEKSVPSRHGILLNYKFCFVPIWYCNFTTYLKNMKIVPCIIKQNFLIFGATTNTCINSSYFFIQIY